MGPASDFSAPRLQHVWNECTMDDLVECNASDFLQGCNISQLSAGHHLVEKKKLY